MSYTKEDIIRMVEEGDVEFIRMQFTDIFGRLKNVAITSSQIKKAVNNEIMIDGSSIEGFVRSPGDLPRPGLPDSSAMFITLTEHRSPAIPAAH